MKRPVELRLRPEMEQKADFQFRGAQAVVKLAPRRGMQLVRRFDFADDFVIDDHVKSLPGELFAFVHDTNADFSPYQMAAVSQFPLARHHIDVLEKPEAQGIVNLEERADNITREWLLDQLGSWDSRLDAGYDHASVSFRSQVLVLIRLLR